MNLTKKAAGLFAVVAAVGMMGTGSVLAAEADAASPLLPSIPAMAAIEAPRLVMDGMLDLKTATEVSTEDMEEVTITLYGDNGIVEMTPAVETVPAMEAEGLAHIVPIVTIAKQDENGNLLVSYDGGQTWETVQSVEAE